MVLCNIDMRQEAESVIVALMETYATGERTPDVGSTLSSEEFMDRVVSCIVQNYYYRQCQLAVGSVSMKDVGHRACVEAALNFEITDRTPVNNFALVTAARSAEYKVDQARWDPILSAKVSIDYALRTESDFVKPILDSQVPFRDLGMDVRFPEDDYGRVSGHIVESEEQVDDLVLFDPYTAEQCPGFTKVMVESLEEISHTLPEDLHVCGLSWGPITTAGYCMGVEDMLMAIMFGETNMVKKLIAKVTGLVSGMQRRMIDAGATVMWMADPTSSCDIISPDMFGEFSEEYIKRVVDDVNTISDVPTFVHICGNTLDIIDPMKRTGADCLSFDHTVNITKAKELAGDDLVLMGNLDPVELIMFGTPERIIAESYMLIDAAGREGGFVLAPGCETPISSPDENVLAMGRAGKDYWTRSRT